MNLIEEIELLELDKENPPIINIFDDNTSYLIFEEFPPENIDELYFEDFEEKLTEILKVKVIREDRELFLIFSNSLEVIKKLQTYLEEIYKS